VREFPRAHGRWSRSLGNMVFLWVFGPEIEDAMGPLLYLVFYLAPAAD
jgi:membrane associated rhomboid family serine protease